MTDFIRVHLSQIRSQKIQKTITPVYKAVDRGNINKSRLPNPIKFYDLFNIKIRSGAGWQMVKCPFHDDKHASMGVNREHGGYKCHACGSGGDRISFYMQWHKATFIETCKALQLIEGAL